MVDSARNWRWPRQPGNARRSWGCWRRWPAGSRRTRRRFAQLALLGTGAVDVEVELEVFDGLQRPEDVAVPAEPLAGLRRVGGRNLTGRPHRSGREPLGSSGSCRPVLRLCIAAPSTGRIDPSRNPTMLANRTRSCIAASDTRQHEGAFGFSWSVIARGGSSPPSDAARTQVKAWVVPRVLARLARASWRPSIVDRRRTRPTRPLEALINPRLGHPRILMVLTKHPGWVKL